MNRKLRDVLVLVATSLIMLFSIPSVGQVLKGSISGTVVDPQGAVVSGAQVKATHTSTGTVLNTKSDSAGLFRFNLIPVGAYKVEISGQGFKNEVQNDVVVGAGRDTGLGEVRLAVGGASETVEVTAAAPLIETTQAQVSSTFAGTTLQTFAGIQENQGLDNLALFVPGVSSVRDNSFSNTNGGAGFSSNGLRGRNNDQEIDGQNNNDNSVAGPSLFISDTEFVGQYVIVTNNFGPEYGRNSGSVVNIITKSGTNAWHGSVYATENNSWLNSMNNFQKQFETDAAGNPLTKPPRLNNEFGGFTVGGPLVKNKWFLFGGFDQDIISTQSIFSTASVSPTPAGLTQLNACFPGSAGLQALNNFGPYAISGGNPTPGPADLFNVGTCANVPFATVTRVLPTPTHDFNFTSRSDATLTGSDSLTGRYLFNRGNTFNNDFGQAAAGFPVNVPGLSQAILVSETHNFSSRMVNEARVGFNRLNVDFGGNSLGTVPTANNLSQALTNIAFGPGNTAVDAAGNTVGTFLGIGPATNIPQSRIVNTWQAQDNWTFVVGKHNFKAGVNWTYQRSPNIFLPDINGAYRFTNFATFAADTPNRVRIADGVSGLDFREYDTFLYAGDDWKIGKNLTLNLGLTWTYYGQPANLFNSITTARESNPATAFWASTEPATSSVGAFLNPGSAIPLADRTDPSLPSVKNSFGPSLGFAYSPDWGGFLTGHGKTTIRGGFRMLYDPPYYNIFLNVSGSSPFVFLDTLPAPATHPMPGVPIGPNVRNALQSSIQTGVFDPRTFAQTTVSPNFGPDKVNSWSFGIERELSKNSAFEARYAGNRGYDLFQSVNGNPYIADLQAAFPNLVPAGVTPCPASQAFNDIAIGRVNCNQGISEQRNNQGYSYYNALQLEFRANNLFKQLTMRAGYTWSKTMDNVSEIFSTLSGGNTVTLAQNPINPTTGEYSYSGLDYPNTFTLLVTEQLPFFKEQHGLIGHLLGGWGVSSDYIWQSGQRYTPAQLGAEAFSGAAGDFYDFLHADPKNPAITQNGFLANFLGFDSARPFVGNVKAPASAVGIYAGDACGNFGVACSVAPNQLISFNSLNGPTLNIVDTTPNQVRYIINSGESQTIFNTPFGGARNLSQDAVTNIANLSVFKTFKFNEKNSFQIHMTMLNAFNHQNFQSVDPVIEDAGLHAIGTGFGDPSVTNSTPFFYSAPATRIIYFGGTFRF